MRNGTDRTAGEWRQALEKGVTAAEDFPSRLPVDREAVKAVSRQYPLLINAYYLNLIRTPGDALWRQVVPAAEELADCRYREDPLQETGQAPVPGLIHRYPDRVIFLASARCPVLCRFCMRKRLAGRSRPLSGRDEAAVVAYIAATPSIREVILSGGDPFLLEDDHLDDLLARISALPHVETLRIHTRVPGALPQRVTRRLTDILRKYHPLYVNIHCNHPGEITPAMAAACARMADAGLPLGSQTVLLKGVNDSAEVMRTLMRRLLRVRVKPYYLHHPDLVRGTAHFRVPVERGLAIMRSLYGYLSGSAVPRYMIDLPGGGGKVPLLPEYVTQWEQDRLVVTNYKGERCSYPAGE